MHVPMWLVVLTGVLWVVLLVWLIVGWLYTRTLVRALDAAREVK